MVEHLDGEAWFYVRWHDYESPGKEATSYHISELRLIGQRPISSPAPEPKAEETNGCLCYASTEDGGWHTPDACPVHGWREDPTPERIAECRRDHARHAEATERFLDFLIANPDRLKRYGSAHMAVLRLLAQRPADLMPGALRERLTRERNAANAEVERLKAELERTEQSRNAWIESHSKAEHLRLEWQARAEAAEAKLADVEALLRVDRIMEDQPEGQTITQIITKVLAA